MTDDLTALRALAEKATPGPWEAFEDSDEHLAGCPPTMEWLVTATDPGEEFYEEIINWGNRGRREDAEFIAAANPSVVLALLDRLERAEALATREGFLRAVEVGLAQLRKTVERAQRAEAAIERVRAVLASWELVQERNREQFESGNPGMITPIDCVGGLRAALDTGKETGK